MALSGPFEAEEAEVFPWIAGNLEVHSDSIAV